MLHQQMRMLAGYNAWANAKLYDAAGRLSEEDYRRDAGVFFRSMHGTLNHILVADRTWMHRFTGEGPTSDRLDATPFETRESLREARVAEDDRIERYVADLCDDALASDFTYRTVSRPDDEMRHALAPAVAHLFNHQTHHRGQAHAILTRLAGDAPALDIIYFLRETS